jgi:hypothetical protein
VSSDSGVSDGWIGAVGAVGDLAGVVILLPDCALTYKTPAVARKIMSESLFIVRVVCKEVLSADLE